VKDKLVSIIIPVYKTEKWLPKCIESCLKQTYKNIEVILIDDGSPDNCGVICDNYAQKDKRIKSLHQVNGGVSVARNTGLDHASGDYIMFVDSDDTIAPNAIEIMRSNQNDSGFDLVAAKLKYTDKIFISAGYDNRFSSEVKTEKSLVLKKVAKEPSLFSSACAKLYKRNIIESNHIRFSSILKYGEDGSFVWKYLEYVSTLFYIKKELYFYRQTTYDKSVHYQFGDVEYQWRNSITLHKNYKRLFLNTGTYSCNKKTIDSQLIGRIKQFLNSSILYHADKSEVIKQLVSLPYTGLYNDIRSLSLLDVGDLLERIVLLCCKYKLWNSLFYLFRAKFFLYNKVYKNMKNHLF